MFLLFCEINWQDAEAQIMVGTGCLEERPGVCPVFRTHTGYAYSVRFVITEYADTHSYAKVRATKFQKYVCRKWQNSTFKMSCITVVHEKFNKYKK
jgi:hypothetical protein